MPNSSAFQNVTLSQSYGNYVTSQSAAALSSLIGLYAGLWTLAWGLPFQNSAGQSFGQQANPQPGQRQSSFSPPQQYAALSIPTRLMAQGTLLASRFAELGTLKTLIETTANAYLAAEGVPTSTDSMGFVVPFVVNTPAVAATATTPAVAATNVFALPGVPVGHQLSFSADGITWTYTPPADPNAVSGPTTFNASGGATAGT